MSVNAILLVIIIHYLSLKIMSPIVSLTKKSMNAKVHTLGILVVITIYKCPTTNSLYLIKNYTCV